MEHIFLRSIWSEDPVPSNAEGCTRCELFEQRTRIIWGEGNPKAPIIVILDNPGCREDKEGHEFVCGTRQTLQLAADAVGLQEKDLYVTYLLKCKPVRRYDKETARTTCFGYLEQQLRADHFKIAFCLGDTAAKAFFKDPEMSVKSIRGIWHQVTGIPTYVSYHPLAVRRMPNLYGNFIKDWKAVAHMARGE
jgi:uracil-DNA glycosylase